MKVKTLKIGNSRWIHIPDEVICEVGLGETATLKVVGEQIVVYPDISREERKKRAPAKITRRKNKRLSD